MIKSKVLTTEDGKKCTRKKNPLLLYGYNENSLSQKNIPKNPIYLLLSVLHHQIYKKKNRACQANSKTKITLLSNL